MTRKTITYSILCADIFIAGCNVAAGFLTGNPWNFIWAAVMMALVYLLYGSWVDYENATRRK